ncbi:hypothetical protein GCM10010495_30920 [Kitasatospora herbaricolor]|uniref:hypothetical protein n=1 Tax=Kitasatospora herbaricolor TaxID=68217 RepID=UPI0019B1A945|nr:hypothetical protein [Kitasatospora herbaricolor]MDQ0312276.1 hypothetical protein [Kitasatospora herbaricolor]GGV14760.1 hypothetical protein GCM10010495_30920 [Kitasatospora herbaricolor]
MTRTMEPTAPTAPVAPTAPTETIALTAAGPFAGPRHQEALPDLLVTFLETGSPPAGLFRPDVFCDLTVPQWRLQAAGVPGLVALRKAGHPAPGLVPRRRVDPTPTGFVIELEERWEQDGQSWYCRELMRADVEDGMIARISVYCTGDWDAEQQRRHGREVVLLRP